MARLTVPKEKKSPRTTELSRLKEELRSVSEKFASRERELSEASDQQAATSDILRLIARSFWSPTDSRRAGRDQY